MPDRTKPVHGFDVSNWQGSDIRSLLAVHQPEHIVVRLSTESLSMSSIAVTQLRAAQDFGATCSGYIWCYWGLDPERCMEQALTRVVEKAGVPLTIIWLDCEDKDNLPPEKCDDWLSRATAYLEERGYRVGIYTGKYWWEPNVADHVAFARLPLWLAHYDENPVLDSSLLPVGGWDTLAGKQYTDSPIDLNVFTYDVTHIDTITPKLEKAEALLHEALLLLQQVRAHL